MRHPVPVWREANRTLQNVASVPLFLILFNFAPPAETFLTCNRVRISDRAPNVNACCFNFFAIAQSLKVNVGVELQLGHDHFPIHSAPNRPLIGRCKPVQSELLTIHETVLNPAAMLVIVM